MEVNYIEKDERGNVRFYKDKACKILHHTDGPAVIQANGTKVWYVNDKLHRLDGPAIEWAGGVKEWFVNGNRHRLDGPAIEWADGTKTWYVNGEFLTEEEFLDRTRPVEELTIAQIEQLLGKRVKIIK